MGFKKNATEWLLIFIGVFFGVVSIYLDILSSEDSNWFSRSGSIMVLLAVIVEYRLSSYIYEDIDNATRQTAKKRAVMPKVSDNPLVDGVVKSNLTSKPQPSNSRATLKLISHILVIVGTIIWGYADVWVK